MGQAATVGPWCCDVSHDNHSSAADASSAVGAIATFDLVVLDTPEPRALADFYCALLGWRINREDDDWVTIRGDSGAGMAFQLAPDLVPPTWPDPAVPQQFHLDVNVPDLDAAEERVLAIGATADRSAGAAEPGSGPTWTHPGIRSVCAWRRLRLRPAAAGFRPASDCAAVEGVVGAWQGGAGALRPADPRPAGRGPGHLDRRARPSCVRGSASTGRPRSVRPSSRMRSPPSCPPLGRSAVRVSTSWWWRPASLRLEFGRTDVDMLLGGWVDDAALRRELLDPFGPGGTRSLPSPATGPGHRPVRPRGPDAGERSGGAAAGRPVPAGRRAAAGCRRAPAGIPEHPGSVACPRSAVVAAGLRPVLERGPTRSRTPQSSSLTTTRRPRGQLGGRPR